MTQCLYVLQNGHHNRSYQPSSLIVVIFPLVMRIFRIRSPSYFQRCSVVHYSHCVVRCSPMTCSFYNDAFVPLVDFLPPFHTRANPCLEQHPSVLYSHDFLLFQILHIRESTWYFSLFVWLISFSIMTSKSIHVVSNGKRSLFVNGRVTSHCV